MLNSIDKKQMAFDFDAPSGLPETTDEESAHDCFWAIHQYKETCSCGISWTNWEERTKRSVWEIA